jgi:acyl-CoA synthetase (AMP-forming)/AMP-acid ligase II
MTQGTSTHVAGNMLAWAARQHRGRTALIRGDEHRTYDEVEARSNQLAHALLSLNLRVGERVAALLTNSFESVYSVFGAEKAGLVYVALNSRHTLAEHAAILTDAEASAVLIGPEFAAIGRELAGRVPSLRHVIALGWQASGALDFEALLATMPLDPPQVLVPPDALIRIAYTSGTTGRPKGVAYTLKRWHERLNNHFQTMEYRLGVEDAMLHVAPLTHASGVYLLPCYLRGARNIIVDRFDPERMLQLIERHRITQLMCVPTMLSRLLETMGAGAQCDLSSLQRIHYGTAPTPPELIQRAIAQFGPILRQQYGMTEAVQPLCVLYPHEHVLGNEEILRSCGKPIPNITITVRDDDGRAVNVDEIGEIAIGYEGIGEVMFWRRPELMEEAVRGGWYYTGDLGRFDRDGFLYIVGRNKEMIISGGFNVYAREVEEALASHPAVAEVAVLGLPHPDWGECVAAFIVRRMGAAPSTKDLIEHCAERIAGYKKPRLIEFLDAMPRNEAGKILKQQLRDSYLQWQTAEASP